jgi:hypothetical protein
VDEYREITAVNGENIKVSIEDYGYLSQFHWNVNHYGYAVRYAGMGKYVLMHREILGAEESSVVDHIDRYKLNNARDNLRIVTPKQNSANTSRHSDGSSKYKGISVRKKDGSFQMRVRSGDKTVSIIFDNEECAAAAYDYYAKDFFGEYSCLNNVDIPKEVWEKSILSKGRSPKFTSQHRGVIFDKSRGKWRAEAKKDGKKYFAGRYETEKEAALAYNKKAIELFGDKAVLNNV